MHDVTILWVASEDVGDDFAECLREDSLVNVFDSVVYVFLCGRNTTHHITIIHIFYF